MDDFKPTMKLIFAMLLVAQVITGCETTHYSCRDFKSETRTNAYSYVLTANNVPFELTGPTMICMDKDIWDQDGFYKIEQEIEMLYRGVAANLTDQDEVRRVASWIEEDNVPHDYTVSSRGTFVVIYSGSPEEADKNRAKLYSLLSTSKSNQKKPVTPPRINFDTKFFFGTKEFMKTFSDALTEKEIPHVLDPDGYIHYSSADKEQVQIIGDELVHDYVQNKP